jgi:hypothetical protein
MLVMKSERRSRKSEIEPKNCRLISWPPADNSRGHRHGLEAMIYLLDTDMLIYIGEWPEVRQAPEKPAVSPRIA